MEGNFGIPMKYPIKVCILELEHVSEESRQRFRDDFDEVYNVFAVKLGDLMEEYGVKHLNSKLSKDIFNPRV